MESSHLSPDQLKEIQEANTKRKRLSLALPDLTAERIARLQDISEAETVTEVIRRALALYEKMLLAVKDGDKILVERKSGQVAEIELI